MYPLVGEKYWVNKDFDGTSITYKVGEKTIILVRYVFMDYFSLVAVRKVV